MNALRRFVAILVLVVLSTPVLGAGSLATVGDLRCEYRVNPLGIDRPAPRLSWVLESSRRGERQTAYRVLVASSRQTLARDVGDVWDSGKVLSGESLGIRYSGKPLQSDCVYFWKVRVWDRDGEPTAWSPPAFWSTGLLDSTDWKARWIGLDRAVDGDAPDSPGRRLSARMLRREFTLHGAVERATAFVCGLGLFELYVNGRKIGDNVLAPALSEYDRRVYYQTLDVTGALRQGRNAVGVVLGNGRYFAPRKDNPTRTRTFGFPKLLLQINVHFEDGTTVRVISDGRWKVTAAGPIRANNEYDGEVYDARREMPGWANPGFDDSDWRPVELVEGPRGVLASQPNEPIKVTQTLEPVALNEPKSGVWVFDMGQNMVGWVRLHVRGKRGTRVRLRFAEVLNPDGTLNTANLRSAKATDVYILKGQGEEVWEPRFTYHGFRYVELTGYPGEPDLSTIEGRVVHDALEKTGDFACSNPLLNQIYRNAVWGIRGNYRSVPTDCPQRDERQGWLGDRSEECRGESFIFHVVNLYSKWMQDVQDAQRPSGSIPDLAPAYWPFYNDNTTWPGTFLIAPGNMLDQYGDVETVRAHYEAMKRWVRYMHRYVENGIMTRDSYGDWCYPPKNRHLIHSHDTSRMTSGELIGTAYFYHELRLLQRFADLLGKPAEADAFGTEAEVIKRAFNDRFLDTGLVQYANNSQTSSILPLAFGLVPEKYRQRVFENLLTRIMSESAGHVGTGLVGCQWLMRTLTYNGRPDVAYLLASQTTYPSWGYMVKHGATTIWELWNGDSADPAMNSHNHVMLLGDLVTWFYENLAGIRSDPERPGFAHLVMRPEVVGDLTWVKASYRSVRGLVESHWQIRGGTFRWELTVPANVEATVYVPAESSATVLESGKPASRAEGVRFLCRTPHRAVYEVSSGHYVFTSNRFERLKATPYVRVPTIRPSGGVMLRPGVFRVRLACETAGAEIRYTLDGSDPDKESKLYEGEIELREPAVLKARAFKPGLHPSGVRTACFDFATPGVNGLRYTLYRGTFRDLPDFGSLQPVRQGVTYELNLEKIQTPDRDFALLFEGQIDVPVSGLYWFFLDSNDGSRLYVDDRLVVDNGGLHKLTERTGTVRLSAGEHRLRVEYFQSGGGKALTVSWKGPGFARRRLAGSALLLPR